MRAIFNFCLIKHAEAEDEESEDEEEEGVVTAEGGGDVKGEEAEAEVGEEIGAAAEVEGDDGLRVEGELRLREEDARRETGAHIAQGEVKGDEDADADERAINILLCYAPTVVVAAREEEDGNEGRNPQPADPRHGEDGRQRGKEDRKSVV